MSADPAGEGFIPTRLSPPPDANHRFSIISVQLKLQIRHSTTPPDLIICYNSLQNVRKLMERFIIREILKDMGFLSGSAVENSPAMQKTWLQSLDLEDLLEEDMATHSSTHA